MAGPFRLSLHRHYTAVRGNISSPNGMPHSFRVETQRANNMRGQKLQAQTGCFPHLDRSPALRSPALRVASTPNGTLPSFRPDAHVVPIPAMDVLQPLTG
jgi:hypothetical protein